MGNVRINKSIDANKLSNKQTYKTLYIRLTRHTTTKNLDYLKNEVVTHFSCSQFFV